MSRHGQPRLAVDDLVVRPWEVADAQSVAAAYSDPVIQRWHARSMTEQEALAWVLSWRDRWTAETGAGWAIVRADAVVGRVGFRELRLVDGAGEVAYWVLPAARGRGVAARALTAVTDWMFTHVGLHRATLSHSTRNEPSCRVAAKAGYAYEGTQVEQALHADGWHDMHLHARVRRGQR